MSRSVPRRSEWRCPVTRSSQRLPSQGLKEAKEMTDRHQLLTSHGSIVVEGVGRGDLPVLLIHGNSTMSLHHDLRRPSPGGAGSTQLRPQSNPLQRRRNDPVTRSISGNSTRNVEGSPMLSSAGKILVVDDDPIIREMITGFFADHNLPATTASNGQELRRHLEGDDPSLVLLDLRLRTGGRPRPVEGNPVPFGCSGDHRDRQPSRRRRSDFGPRTWGRRLHRQAVQHP